MLAEHRLRIKGKCPEDGTLDDYECIVRTRRVLLVEEILRAAQRAGDRKRYQEQIAEQMAQELRAEVELIGWHSGVCTRVRCGELSREW